MRCEFYIPDDKDLYRSFEAYKEEINNKFEFELEWMFLEGRKASRIRTVAEADISSTEQWDEYFSWLLQRSSEFQDVFLKYYKKM